MSNKKQTAVEWLIYTLRQDGLHIPKIYESVAEQKEKQQIIDAYKSAEDKYEFFEYEHRYGREYLTAEPYYNETFKNK